MASLFVSWIPGMGQSSIVNLDFNGHRYQFPQVKEFWGKCFYFSGRFLSFGADSRICPEYLPVVVIATSIPGNSTCVKTENAARAITRSRQEKAGETAYPTASGRNKEQKGSQDISKYNMSVYSTPRLIHD